MQHVRDIDMKLSDSERAVPIRPFTSIADLCHDGRTTSGTFQFRKV